MSQPDSATVAERQPLSDRLDAIVDMANDEPHGLHAFALVKTNVSFAGGSLERLPATPLENDIRDDALEPRIPPHTDFWPYRPAVDVIVSGHAYPTGGIPAPRFEAAIEVGEWRKRLAAFGPRTLRFVQGRPVVSPPEAVERVALERSEAYGGTDELVWIDAEESSAADLALHFDHPGLYPRNEDGRGYVVVPHDERDVLLPGLEDPDDLLTLDRIVVPHPSLWHRQPLPCYLGRSSLTDFPRMAYAGIEAWFVGPEDEHMPEVARGLLPANYRGTFSGGLPDSGFDPRIRQQASPGACFPALAAGTPIRLHGMHPERPRFEFRLPEEPLTVEIEIAGDVRPVAAELQQLVIHPDEQRYEAVHVARAPLPRPYLPGVHKRVPISAKVEGVVVEYEQVETVRETLARVGGSPNVGERSSH